MSSTLHVLPATRFDLRPLRHDLARHPGQFFVLTCRTERAHPLWELVVSLPALKALLESLSEGQTTVSVNSLRLQVYADAGLEREVKQWARRELSRLGADAALPPPRLQAEVLQQVGGRLI